MTRKGSLPPGSPELTPHPVSLLSVPLRLHCSPASLLSSQSWKSVTESKRNSSFSKLNITGEGEQIALGTGSLPPHPHGNGGGGGEDDGL